MASPLSGVVYDIKNAGNQIVHTGTTDAHGKIVCNLSPGEYSVHLKTIPNGYSHLNNVLIENNQSVDENENTIVLGVTVSEGAVTTVVSNFVNTLPQ